MEPDSGRDATVAIVLTAAIVAVAGNSIVLGVLVLAVAAAAIGLVALIQSRGPGSRSPHNH